MSDSASNAYKNMITESNNANISKSQINDVLKSHGLSVIKASESTSTGFPKVRSVKTMLGQSVKGIVTGSIGPLTATNAHVTSYNEKLKAVHNDLKSLGVSHDEESNTYYANRNSKNEISFSLIQGHFPAYVGINSNSEYKNIAIVPHFHEK